MFGLGKQLAKICASRDRTCFANERAQKVGCCAKPVASRNVVELPVEVVVIQRCVFIERVGLQRVFLQNLKDHSIPFTLSLVEERVQALERARSFSHHIAGL